MSHDLSYDLSRREQDFRVLRLMSESLVLRSHRRAFVVLAYSYVYDVHD